MNGYLLLHDSHSAKFRSPFGAVSCHTPVTLRLLISPPGHNAAPPLDEVLLRLWQDGIGETVIKMAKTEDVGGQTLYEGIVPADGVSGVIWYYFIVRQDGKAFYYGNNGEQMGGRGSLYDYPPPSYQISKYISGARTPAWFKEAIVYQIFVDRFYNGQPGGQALNPRPGTLIHAAWQDTPVYTRDMDTGAVLAYDFFGGNLAGVMAKLPYLKELGVTAIYLNPIFDAPSNHKYDTADYKKIDPMFGDNKLFSELCANALAQGIRVILDGVFSHTGSDSIYFNQDGTYDSVGACQSPDSPYYSWYKFTHYPDQYESWWGIGTLPNVNEEDPAYQRFIIDEEDSVLGQWLKLGASGWRLDVADELPESFLKKFYQTLKAAQPEGILIGEVWEDASHKVAYGELRQYFNGSMLDSVMNYPFRKLVLDFMLGWQDAQTVHRALFSLYENYPLENFYANLNIIGSHDVPRILTILAEAPAEENHSKLNAFKFSLTETQRKLGVARLKLATLWQFTFPGAPCIYYGDEAGVEGYSDPLNRRTYPWGQEDTRLLNWYRKLTGLRSRHKVLSTGEWIPLVASGDVYGYVRRIKNGQDVFGSPAADNTCIILINRSSEAEASVVIDANRWFTDQDHVVDALTDETIELPEQDALTVTIPPLSGRLLMAEIEPTAAVRERSSGVLLHPTSLPSPFGIGDLGPEAYKFIDLLADSKQQLWQFLPINPLGFGESPYQCLSAFAGNHLLISPEKLAASGMLPEEALRRAAADGFQGNRVDFQRVKLSKEKLFRQAFDCFKHRGESCSYQNFLEKSKHWLTDYTLFIALKQHFGGTAWQEWDSDIKGREPVALAYWRQALREEIEYQTFLQYVFWQQWQELKSYAQKKKVKLFGDMPLFIAGDSADVWSYPHLFKLDSDGQPTKVAGVPPDYFSKTGQFWGNPLYNWGEMAKDDYLWWRCRLEVLLELVDMVRIDHFRGFEAYWEIPAGEASAVNGRWVKGPGAEFFKVVKEYLGGLPLVAEDLGVITPAVNRLKHGLGFPGMKVLQFSFGDGTSAPAFPQNTGFNTIAYTGTHDNDTLLGWFRKLEDTEPGLKRIIVNYLGSLQQGVEESDLAACEQLIRLTYISCADTVIIPMQDVLLLDSEARMNTPGTIDDNWVWRLKPDQLTAAASARLAAWAELGGRNRIK